MKAYGFDEYGACTGAVDCQRDPARSEREGRDCFLLPANATEAEPPEFDRSTQLARWDGEEWHLEELPPAPEPGPRPEPGPSAMDRLEAQVFYTAMVTDTLLETAPEPSESGSGAERTSDGASETGPQGTGEGYEVREDELEA